MTPIGDEIVRIDKWLWAARFFRTRALACQAVAGGKVTLNGARAKPSRPLAVGDALSVRRGDVVFDIVVVRLDGRRGPASVAARLYSESDDSRLRREAARETRRSERASAPQYGRRPDKRGRRRRVAFTANRD